MANLLELQKRVVELMQANRMNPGSLYNAVEAAYRDSANELTRLPIARTTFYNWFSERRPAKPSALLLEVVPALAKVFDVTEHELYRAAGLLPGDMDAALVLADAARQMRVQVRSVTKVLQDSRLSGAAEALVVDRILRSRLDYRIMVWPVVRGRRVALHLRSWIGLQPVVVARDGQRDATAAVEALELEDRRRHIRQQVIGESLWRSLGLRWRDLKPLEWPEDDNSKLRIELPVDEKNRAPKHNAWRFGSPFAARLLALSGLWGHGEPLAALIADTLQWGSYDIRYQGFGYNNEAAEKQNFIRRTLVESAPSYVWALSESEIVLRAFADNILQAAEHHLVILITYGEAVTASATEAWKADTGEVASSQEAARDIARRVNEVYPVIHVHYDDADLPLSNANRVDVDVLTDQVRYATVDILKLLQRHMYGPTEREWKGSHFDDMREGEWHIVAPARRSRVVWCRPGELGRS